MIPPTAPGWFESLSGVLDPFRGLQRAPKPKTRPILGNILTYFDLPWPPPAYPVKNFCLKMACTCVPHIVLHVSCQTRTSGGYFRPSEVRFRAKIPLSSHWFYNVKTQKTQFLQNRAWEMAEIENIHCPICTQPIPSSWQNALPPALATSVQRGAPYSFELLDLFFLSWPNIIELRLSSNSGIHLNKYIFSIFAHNKFYKGLAHWYYIWWVKPN